MNIGDGSAGEVGLPSGCSSGRRKTAYTRAVPPAPGAGSQALRVGVALVCPKQASIAGAIGIRVDTMNQYLNGRREVPPAVNRVLATVLREQSANLLVAASALEAA